MKKEVLFHSQLQTFLVPFLAGFFLFVVLFTHYMCQPLQREYKNMYEEVQYWGPGNFAYKKTG